MKRSLIAVGLAVLGVCSLGAAEFLTQAEIRARLDELHMPLSDGTIRFGIRHVDRCYNMNGPFRPYFTPFVTVNAVKKALDVDINLGFDRTPGAQAGVAGFTR